MLKILSCGAGVQSTTLLLMSCKGVLPKLDHAIFADTGWEPSYIYEHVVWLKKYSEDHGIPFTIVKGRNIKEDNINTKIGKERKKGERFAALPLYTIDKNGKKGILKRQCTAEYKITPINKFLKQQLLGLRPREGTPKYPVVEHWFGISQDEIRRCRQSPNNWTIYAYPLIEDFSPPKTRQDCISWCLANGFQEPPRSACVGCPYKSNHEWRLLKENHPDIFQDAVDFDKKIRNRGGMDQPCFLHPSHTPLDQVDFYKEKSQISMFTTECSGMCNT